jgi:hypothetical protein
MMSSFEALLEKEEEKKPFHGHLDIMQQHAIKGKKHHTFRGSAELITSIQRLC